MNEAHLTQLWPLGKGARDKAARGVARGAITEREAEELLSFGEKGYLVLPGAISGELVDALNADVARIGEHPGCFLTTDHRNGRAQRVTGADFDAYESIFDPYVNLESARKVALHPTVRRWLSLVFEAGVVLTQQLLFQRSNQHPPHQDSSVVCMEDPLLMVATWIALEDVVPGRGELTYYEGSHLIRPYPFVDGKRQTAADDPAAVIDHLLAECTRLGCPKRDFIAKKGDVFFWAADLVHGSNPRTAPVEATRRSLVSHYCPASTKPFWFRFYERRRHVEPWEGGTAYVSQYYDLPSRGGMARVPG